MGLRYLKDVVTLQLNEGKCTGCGMCTVVCPHAVFEIRDKKARVADRDACMECGACAMNCPEEAIAVQAGVGCAAGILSSALVKIGGSSECCECNPANMSQSEPCCAPARETPAEPCCAPQPEAPPAAPCCPGAEQAGGQSCCAPPEKQSPAAENNASAL